jgi:hypothetical protein
LDLKEGSNKGERRKKGLILSFFVGTIEFCAHNKDAEKIKMQNIGTILGI